MGVFHMTLTVALTTGQHYRAACDDCVLVKYVIFCIDIVTTATHCTQLVGVVSCFDMCDLRIWTG